MSATPRFFVLLVLLAGCSSANLSASNAVLQQQVTATEVAFAKTMADRDFNTFTTFIADDAIFYSGDNAQRGKQTVAAAWKRFFDGGVAPFSWQPRSVEVLDSGDLALSTGPVYDADGNVIGVFNSIWRRQRDGRWLIVFDKGCDAVCPAP